MNLRSHAVGILGREIVNQLAKSPDKWKTIYALSRSKKDEYPPNVVHKHIDLLGSVDQMAKDLQGVEAEYIFFTAYMQRDTEQENWQVNGMSHPFQSQTSSPLRNGLNKR